MVKPRAKPKRKSPAPSRITAFDSRLFANLRRANRSLPIKRLAKRLDSSWKTTNDHVTKLEKMKVLKTKRTVRRTNVSIDPSILRDFGFKKRAKKKR